MCLPVTIYHLLRKIATPIIVVHKYRKCYVNNRHDIPIICVASSGSRTRETSETVLDKAIYLPYLTT